MSSPVVAPETRPAFLVIQGRLRTGGDEAYARYLAGTRPLMQACGAEVVAVGEGVASVHTTDAWPINGILRFPSLAAADQFLGDPRYLEIKGLFRDAAYEELHLSVFLGRPPRA